MVEGAEKAIAASKEKGAEMAAVAAAKAKQVAHTVMLKTGEVAEKAGGTLKVYGQAMMGGVSGGGQQQGAGVGLGPSPGSEP